MTISYKKFLLLKKYSKMNRNKKPILSLLPMPTVKLQNKRRFFC